MNILGISAYHGDASVALVRGGNLVGALEEERLNRRKHCAGFPSMAAKAVLAEAGLAKVVGWFQGRTEFGPRALGIRLMRWETEAPW